MSGVFLGQSNGPNVPPPNGAAPAAVPQPVELGPPAGWVQQPDFAILINGNVLPWPISISVSQNNYSEASKFECEVALLPNDQYNASWFSAQISIPVEIQGWLNGGSPTTMIYGLVDSIDYDPISQHVVLSGRDLVGRLIDTPNEQTYQNWTASKVVQDFVNQYASDGMLGDITNTTDMIGRFYGIDYGFTIWDQFHQATNQWDMILFLAQISGFQAQMQGKTLYFGPPLSTNTPPFPLVVTPPPVYSNVPKVMCGRSLTLAKDITVTVLSWNSLYAVPVKRKVSAKGQKSHGGPAQNYTFIIPDKTPEQALQYAYMKLRELSTRERIITVDMPVEFEITPATYVQLQGTGTSWDQVYYIDEIVRNISFAEGGQQSLRLKNHSPYNESVVF